MKYTKRIGAMVIAVILMLALSMSAFANGSVAVYINDYHSGGLTTTYLGSYNIGDITTVYDVISPMTTTWTTPINAAVAYSPLYDINSPLYGMYNQKVTFLQSLNGLGPVAYEPIDGALDEDDYYIPTQTVDTVLMIADAALADYGGLDYWYGNGYGVAADWHHMIYLGWDWKFTVNGTEPGVQIDPSNPLYGGFFGYTMRESLLNNGDRVDLNYVYSFLVFDSAT